MLYFNYFLATENANSDLEDSDIRMNDAFRVYAAGENGVWIQLTTNNSDQGGPDRNTALDEFDTAANRNLDPFGNPLFTQETFDNTGVWRQARTSLAALAGQENVRLRFEFSTGCFVPHRKSATGRRGVDERSSCQTERWQQLCDQSAGWCHNGCG